VSFPAERAQRPRSRYIANGEIGVKERLRHLASLAGRVSTDAKARAALANDLKGGRPTKRAGEPAGRR